LSVAHHIDMEREHGDERRVSDGVITRTIGKWLNAGMMDGGKREYPGKGTPQGEGSPLD